MMIPYEKLREWAECVEPSAAPYVIKFVDEAEAKVQAEVDAAKEVLRHYGFKIYESPQHDREDL